MRKVVLVIPPQEKFHKEHLPSVGIGYIASSLEESDYEVRIIDSHAEGLDDEETVERIIKEEPDAVGITSSSHNRFHAISVCQKIKKRSDNEILVVVGGPHFSSIAVSALKTIPSIDVVVMGEGELTYVDLLDHYFQKRSLDKVLGIVFRKGKNVISNPSRPFVQNLDELPMPAWHLFDLNKYSARLEGERKNRSIGLMSSRGCPNECVFCVNSSFWKRLFRRHSPKRFVDEVEFLNKRYGYRAFDFWDDTLTVMRGHVEEICKEILRRKLDIIWYARARVNTVDKDLLTLMREAGAKVISFGVESGSPRILKNIKKRIKIDQVKRVVKDCVDLNYIVKLFFMYSLPGETIEDIKATRDLMRELKFYGPHVHVLPGFTLVYPGTALEKLAKKEGALASDFNWNVPVEFAINKKIGVNPTIPLYEQRGLKIERIYSFLESRTTKSLEIIKSLRPAIRNLKNLKDVKYLFGRVSRYIQRKI